MAFKSTIQSPSVPGGFKKISFLAKVGGKGKKMTTIQSPTKLIGGRT